MAASLPLPRRKTVHSQVAEDYIRIKDIYIPTRDGNDLCADVFHPLQTNNGVPAILSMGPYGKDIHSLNWGLPQTDIYSKMNAKIKPLGPDACMEYADPIVWTKEYGYALVRVDVRGIGGSPGKLDPWGLSALKERDIDIQGNDLYDAIEWTAKQPWCNGRVAMSGISYLGMVCWEGAQKRPPSLRAIVAWEAGTDFYSQFARPGGILNSNFLTHWWKNAVLPYQHGRAEGVPEESLKHARVDFPSLVATDEYRNAHIWHSLDRHRNLDMIQVPVYSSGNWMDTELHSPGNIIGYMRAGSPMKWLEMHTGDHIGAYYDQEMLHRQRLFLDYFLFDRIGNGLADIPRVDLQIRKGSELLRRYELDFPPPDTRYRSFYLTPDHSLETEFNKNTSNKTVLLGTYSGLTGSLIFTSAPSDSPFEFLGFPYMKLEVSTDAHDMDIFVSVTNVCPDGTTLTYLGNHGETTTSVTRGYMRLSHRELDEEYSSEHLRFLSQKTPATVISGQIYRAHMPIQPGSMIFEKGHRIRVEIGAKDSDSLLPIMRHEGAERMETRFGGHNMIYYGTKIVFPYVIR